MYIKVGFYNCKNVNWDTKDAFKAFFKTIEYHFGTFYDESSSLELSNMRIESKDVYPRRYNTALFFKATKPILTSDIFEYYSKILGCNDGWYIEISETPFEES